MSVEVKIELGHKAWKNLKPTLQGHTHDWTVYVKGANDHEIKHIVKKVIYHLPDSYPNPKQIREKPPFALSESTSQDLTMQIDVFFCAGAKPDNVCYFYDVTISDKDANSSLVEKLTFKDPSNDFKEKLLLAGGRLVGAQKTSELQGALVNCKVEPSKEIDKIKNTHNVETIDPKSQKRKLLLQLLEDNKRLEAINKEVKEKHDLQEKLLSRCAEKLSSCETNILSTRKGMKHLKKKIDSDEKEISILKLQVQMLQNELSLIKNPPIRNPERSFTAEKRKRNITEQSDISSPVEKKRGDVIQLTKVSPSPSMDISTTLQHPLPPKDISILYENRGFSGQVTSKRKSSVLLNSSQQKTVEASSSMNIPEIKNSIIDKPIERNSIVDHSKVSNAEMRKSDIENPRRINAAANLLEERSVQSSLNEPETRVGENNDGVTLKEKTSKAVIEANNDTVKCIDTNASGTSTAPSKMCSDTNTEELVEKVNSTTKEQPISKQSSQNLNHPHELTLMEFMANHCQKIIDELKRLKFSKFCRFKQKTNPFFYKLGKIDSNISDKYFNRYICSITDFFTDPKKSFDVATIVYLVVDYLSNSTISYKTFLNSFTLDESNYMTLPKSENIIISALYEIERTSPHLDTLVRSVLNIIHRAIITKKRMALNGLASLCRVFIDLCRRCNNVLEPLFLCCELLRLKHPLAPYLINCFASVWKDPFYLPNEYTAEEKILLSSIIYGMNEKPLLVNPTLCDITCRLTAANFPHPILVDEREAIKYLTTEIVSRCDERSFKNLWILISPLKIFLMHKNLDYKIRFRNDYVVPNLRHFAKCLNEQAFNLFCNLFVDVCSSRKSNPFEKFQQYFPNTFGHEGEDFRQDYLAIASLKYAITTNTQIPAPLRPWLLKNKDNPKLTVIIDLYCKRVMEFDDYRLLWEDIILF